MISKSKSNMRSISNYDLNFLVNKMINMDGYRENSIETKGRRYNGNFKRELTQRLQLIQSVDNFCQKAFEENFSEDLKIVHRLLAEIYNLYFNIPSDSNLLSSLSPGMFEISQLIESYIFKYEDSLIDEAVFQDIPRSADKYIKWIKDKIERHPARSHILYEQYIPEEFTKEDLIYFFIQETTLDPRFDDVMAFLQIGTSDEIKMEIARNYWDEMGNGRPSLIHANLFKAALKELDITDAKINNNLSIEATICGNLSSMLSVHRHNFYKAVGYFGVTEFLVADRFTQLLKAWRRNKLKEEAIEYHKLHIEIDTKHSDDWFNNVISPLVENQPSNAEKITRGVFYRLNSSQRYLDNILNRFLSK